MHSEGRDWAIILVTAAVAIIVLGFFLVRGIIFLSKLIHW